MSGFSSESFSDNRKSAIQNPKWLGLWVFIFMLTASGAVAQAQQPRKTPRIGYLTGTSVSVASARTEAFRHDCASLSTWKARTLSLSGEVQRDGPIASPRWWPS
jgi:hypothetical protein